MLPVSTKDAIPFTPRLDTLATLRGLQAKAGSEDERHSFQRLIDATQAEIDAGPQPVYRLAAASHFQRAAFRRDLMATGASYAGDAALYETLRRDLEAVAPLNLTDLLAVVDEVEAAGGPAEAAPEARDRWPDITRVARALGGRYAALEGDQEFFLSVAPIVACRHFLLGWEGVKDADGADATFLRRGALTTDETLAQLDEAELRTVGFKIMTLMRPTKDQEKNSASPSRSASSPRPIPTASEPLTALPGSSSENGTSGTPASA